MSNTKISELPQTTSLPTWRWLPIVQPSGNTNISKKISTDDLKEACTWPAWPSWALIIYDCVVAPTWWDYTTVWDALNALKTSIFVKEWNYTETYWDIRRNYAWEVTNIMCESEACVFTFNNTDAHSGMYVKMDTITWISITWWTFNITLNSTNTKFLSGGWAMTQIFNRSKSIFNIDQDNTAVRTFHDCNFVDKNWFFQCRFNMLNEWKKPTKIWDWNSLFRDCVFSWWEIIFGSWTEYARYENCDLESVKWVWYNYWTYINCQFSNIAQVRFYNNAWTTGSWSSIISKLIDTSIVFGSNITDTCLNLEIYNGITSSKVYLSYWTIGIYVWYSWGSYDNWCINSTIYSYWNILIYQNCNNNSITSASGSIYIDFNAITLTWNKFGIWWTNKLYFTSNADYSVLTWNYFSNTSKVEVQWWCTSAVIVWNCRANTVTDGWTSTLIASNN